MRWVKCIWSSTAPCVWDQVISLVGSRFRKKRQVEHLWLETKSFFPSGGGPLIGVVRFLSVFILF